MILTEIVEKRRRRGHVGASIGRLEAIRRRRRLGRGEAGLLEPRHHRLRQPHGEVRGEAFDPLGWQQDFARGDPLELLEEEARHRPRVPALHGRASEVARGRIEHGQTHLAALVPHVHRRERHLLSAFDAGGITHESRRHHLDDLALDQTSPAGLLRILDLLADGDLQPLRGELPDVALGAVRGHPAHRHGIRLALVACGERDVEDGRGALGVLEEHLVEVTHPIEDDGLRVVGLDRQVLAHHRSLECRCHQVPCSSATPSSVASFFAFCSSRRARPSCPAARSLIARPSRRRTRSSARSRPSARSSRRRSERASA